MDGGAWWVAVSGVTQSQTQLECLSFKGFGVVNEAELDFFFFNSLAFPMIQQMLQFDFWFLSLWASLMAQLVKNPPAMPETWV